MRELTFVRTGTLYKVYRGSRLIGYVGKTEQVTAKGAVTEKWSAWRGQYCLGYAATRQAAADCLRRGK